MDNTYSLGTLNKLLKDNNVKNTSDDELWRCAGKTMSRIVTYNTLRKYKKLNLLRIE
jgi:hypothetical protein